MTLLRALMMWLSTLGGPAVQPCADLPSGPDQAEAREDHTGWSAARTACSDDDDDDSIYNGF